MSSATITVVGLSMARSSASPQYESKLPLPEIGATFRLTHCPARDFDSLRRRESFEHERRRPALRPFASELGAVGVELAVKISAHARGVELHLAILFSE